MGLGGREQEDILRLPGKKEGGRWCVQHGAGWNIKRMPFLRPLLSPGCDGQGQGGLP